MVSLVFSNWKQDVSKKRERGCLRGLVTLSDRRRVVIGKKHPHLDKPARLTSLSSLRGPRTEWGSNRQWDDGIGRGRGKKRKVGLTSRI